VITREKQKGFEVIKRLFTQQKREMMLCFLERKGEKNVRSGEFRRERALYNRLNFQIQKGPTLGTEKKKKGLNSNFARNQRQKNSENATTMNVTLL